MSEHTKAIVCGHSPYWTTAYNNCVMCESAALRVRCEAAEDERNHYRTACSSVGETDGHGWAETTKELRQQVADLTQTIEAQLREAASLNQCITDLEVKLEAMTTDRNDLNDTRQGLEAELSEMRQQRNLFRASMQERLRDYGNACEREQALKRQFTAQQEEIGRLTRCVDAVDKLIALTLESQHHFHPH